MNKRKDVRWLAPLLLALLLVALLGSLYWRRPAPRAQAEVIGASLPPSGEAFERADGPRELIFPRDHGPHPDFQTEWWYYTGNLQADDGNRFGFQLTFFRRAVRPAEERVTRDSAWSAEQIYLAHFTLTDVAGKQFHAFERYERGAAGLAGAEANPYYRVWVHDWQVEQTGDDAYHLRAAVGSLAIDLQLVDQKGPVLQGDQGYSRKGPQPGNASLYYSQSRLVSRGTITLEGQVYPVTGTSWMDREISTSALSEGQVGWDWFALQMDDGSELMVYMIRNKDGSTDAFSSGTWIALDGSTTRLRREDFDISVKDHWKSPHSGGIYPARWVVSIPSLGLRLDVRPLLADQELNLSVVYWEGAVSFQGERSGQPVTGSGYVELTGYADSLEGEL